MIGEPSLVATLALFRGDRLLNRTTKYLSMPHFLNANVEAFGKMLRENGARWPITYAVESDTSGKRFLAIRAGEFASVVWFDRSYASLYERG